MKTPAIQNDFSYYRRTIARQRMSSSDDTTDPIEVNTELANRMSLFYANATPMLRVLSDAVSNFVSEVRKCFFRPLNFSITKLQTTL
jgi:CYRIA/CYRIB Rac1 binding domain